MADFKKRFGGAGGHHGKFTPRDGGRPSFGGNRGGGYDRGNFGDRDSGRPMELHKATCADCGNTCEVPFRPNGEKPVYCRDCFGGKRYMPSRDFPKKDFAPRTAPAVQAPARDSRIDDVLKQLDMVNSKLDSAINMLKALSATPAPVSAPVVTKVAAAAPVKAKKEVAKVVPKKVETKKKVVAKKK